MQNFSRLETTRIVKTNMTRSKALKLEQGHVNRVYRAGVKFDPKFHKRPQPNI
ncbi:hypothetical protein [Priestia koreensis]|uniref:hypothetical protein n=1 Tax=Priestia koreensis TaxID=284581 RepID=UPI00334227DB